MHLDCTIGPEMWSRNTAAAVPSSCACIGTGTGSLSWARTMPASKVRAVTTGKMLASSLNTPRFVPGTLWFMMFLYARGVDVNTDNLRNPAGS